MAQEYRTVPDLRVRGPLKLNLGERFARSYPSP